MLVAEDGFEPPTSCKSNRQANHCSIPRCSRCKDTHNTAETYNIPYSLWLHFHNCAFLAAPNKASTTSDNIILTSLRKSG